MSSIRTKLKRVRKRLPSARDMVLLAIGFVAAYVIVQIDSKPSYPAGQLAAALQPSTYEVSIPWLAPQVRKWDQTVLAMSQKYAIDPELVSIIMTVESGGNPVARSEAGALGLMQVTPPTAQDIARKHLKTPVANYDLLEPQTNIEFGVAYLAYLRDTFQSKEQAPSWNTTVELIAAGYNGGPSAALSLVEGGGLRDPETVAYSRDVYNMWRERDADQSPTYDRWLERGGIRLLQSTQ